MRNLRALILVVCAGLAFAAPATASAQSFPADGYWLTPQNDVIYGDADILVEYYGGYVYPWASVPLHWTAQVRYTNVGPNTVIFDCGGLNNPAIAVEHMAGTANAGAVAAEETMCSRFPGAVVTLPPGTYFDNWATFHNVPWIGSTVSLEWPPFGSSEYIDPWSFYLGPGPPPVQRPQAHLWRHRGTSATRKVGS